MGVTMFASRVAARSARVAAPRMPIAAARGYAAPAQAANTKPPVPLYGLDGTYASALYTASAKQESLNDVSKGLENLYNTFKTDKQQVVQELQKTMAVQDKDNTIKNFLQTLAENNRLSVLEGVCEKFSTLMSAARGEVEMTITSAAPLENKMVKQLETAVSKSQYIGQGQKLKVVPKVDPEIRGGLIVEIGDRTIDPSVSAKMARMNKLLTETL